MIYPGKKHVPLLMFLRGHRPSAGEALVHQFNGGHPQNSKLPPVWKTAAAAFACSLKYKKAHHAFLNAIVMRLHDSIFIVIFKAQQAFLMNGRQDELMSNRIHVNRRWVPYYAK
jgi:hypothetical protein